VWSFSFRVCVRVCVCVVSGCSGLYGAFVELGPYLTLDPVSLTLTPNPNSWNSHANLLIIDQPAGTGFSFVNDPNQIVQDEPTMAKQLYNSLLNFYNLFPQLKKNPFFITGESYAGKYIPYLATEIHNQNSLISPSNSSFINLVGMAIGDGWTDPLLQTGVYADQAYNLGLLDETEVLNVNQQMVLCTNLTETQQWQQAQIVCDNLLNFIVNASGGVDEDDTRDFSADEPNQNLPQDYLNQPALQTALHLPSSIVWEQCNDDVAVGLSIDEMIPSVQLLPTLFENYRVILYNGQFDLNCGAVGTEKYLRKLLGDDIFMKAEKRFWKDENDEGRMAGYVRDFTEKLSFVIVSGAGHMVPQTQGKHALNLLTKMINNQPF